MITNLPGFVTFVEVSPKETINLESVELVVFRCRHTSSGTVVGWLVNGTPIEWFPDIRPGSISMNAVPMYSGMVSVYTTVPEVECVSVFVDGPPTETTPLATLIITGLIMMMQVQSHSTSCNYHEPTMSPYQSFPISFNLS